MNITDKIIAFECGEMEDEAAVEFFQELIDSGLVWQLPGNYGRMASHLIEIGLCTEKRH